MTSGYSGTPLARKLTLKDGMRVWFDGMLESVRQEIAAEGLQLQLLSAPEAPIDVAHVFVTNAPISKRSCTGFFRCSRAMA